jgi:serine/threonine protein kinase
VSDPLTCPQCGFVFPPGDAEPALAGLCPRCLAGGLGNSTVEEDVPPATNNAAVRIDTIRAPLQPGSVFKGFEILEILGQGGMGVVYKARQQSLNRLVALKLLSSQLATSEEFAKRFDREAKVLASVNHPNVVHVHDFGKADGLLYLVMEHVDGPTLEDMMKKKPAEPARFLRAVLDVARGLQQVHEAGLVHRDIKPSNILVTRDGTAKISDFGLAIETDETQKLTQSGMFVGTPHYVSPEHAQGKKIDGRSDLYSLGVILFEGFAGRPPFQAPSATAILLKHVNEAPPALYKLAPQSPKSVQEIVRKLLAKNPASRHDTAASLGRDLERALQEVKAGPKPVPGTARKVPAAAPASEPKPSLPVKLIAAGVAAGAVLAILIALFAGKSEPKKEPKPAETAKMVVKPALALAPEPEKPKDPEPQAPPAQTPDPPAPRPAEPKEPPPLSAVETALKQGDALFDRARELYEDGKARSSVETMADASFKAEEAKAKFSAVQEIGNDVLKAKGADRIKLVQQFLKLVNESRLAIKEAAGVPSPAPSAPPTPAPSAGVPGAPPAAVPVPAAPSRREPAPETAALKDAEKTIREVYKADYAKKGPADQQALAVKLLAQGKATNDDPRAKYVLLREARDLALLVGDLDTLLAALAETGRAFEIDLVATKSAALTKIQVRTPEATAALTEALMDLARDAYDADNYEIATASSARADAMPKPAHDPALASRLADLRKEIASAKEDFAKVKSSIDKPGTGDQEALGKYYAFTKGDWDRGLAILAASAKPPLNTLAEKDLARPEEAATQIDVADGWWDLAEKERTPQRKSRLQDRAKYWYEAAYPSATGLNKAKIEKHLDALDAAVKGPVDLLRLIDPRTDSVNGGWSFEKGSLVSAKEWYGRIQVRYVPPEEYDLRLVVERRDHDEDLIVGMAKGDTQITANLDAGHSSYSAFGIQATRADQSPQYSGKLFTYNRPAILICSVRKKSVSVTVDGKKVLTYAWKGDEARSLIASQWEIPNRRILFVGAHGTSFAVHSMLLTPVTGAGHIDRTGGAAPLPPPAAKSAPTAPIVAAKGTIDLIALVDPKIDAVKGDFTKDQGGLLTPPGTDFARIHLPFIPPAEYELTIEGFRRTDGDCFGIGLVDGDRQAMVMLAGLDGGTCGLEMIDGFNYMINNTKVTGIRLEKFQAFKVICTVRRTGIDVSLNGRQIIHWQGDGKRLAVWEKWQVPQKNVIFLGSQGSRFHITQATLNPITGQGAFLRKPVPPALGPPIAKGATVDLLSLVDPAQDSVEGDWSLDGPVLVARPGSHVRCQLPVLPPEEYDLRIVLTRVQGEDAVAFGLAQGGTQWVTFVDKVPQEGFLAGLENLDGGQSTLVRGQQIVNDHPVTFDIRVRKGGFSVLKDGKPLMQWQGNLNRLGNHVRWVMKNPRTLFLGQWGTTTHYSEIKLTAVSGEGRLLRGGAPATAAKVAAPAKGAVDVLALVDPKRDAVNGEYAKDGRTLITPAATDYARIEIPYVPPAEYDVLLEVERTQGDNCLAIGLPGVRQFAVVIDGSYGTQTTGIDCIDDKGMSSNETTIKGKQIPMSKPVTILCSVRKTGVSVSIDGRKIIDWKGPLSRLSLWSNWAVPHKNMPLIGTCTTEYRISRMELTPVGR